jgi:hypothetical protein
MLQELFQSNSPLAKKFHTYIRHVNNALSYTSMSYTTDRRLGPQEQSYIFQVQGTVYHYQGPLCGGIPAFAQLYFLDPQAATDIRLESQPSLKDLQPLLAELDALFRARNPFHRLFHRARDILDAHTDLPYIRPISFCSTTTPATTDA